MSDSFPFAFETNDKGHLCFAGWDTLELAQRFGTPLYVLDEDRIRERCRSFRKAAAKGRGDGVIAYAAKAFFTMGMARLMQQEGIALDVVSGGEIYTAFKAGYPMENVQYNGNNKSHEELSMALELGVGRIIVDNQQELRLLEQIAASQNLTQRILLRISPGVEAHTHEYIRTGQQDSKFGFDLITGDAMEAIQYALKSEHLELVGIHCHIGSQIFDTQPFVEAARTMCNLIEEAHQKTGWLATELDLGGGFGIRYLPEDEPIDADRVLDDVHTELDQWSARTGLTTPRLLIEPGRAIVGDAGITLYTVGAIKKVEGLLPYVAVDGGMADNPRPSLYGARYHAVICDRPLQVGDEDVHLVGRYCESGDVLIPSIHLPSPRTGDVVAVFSTGAYNYSMASNYNRYPRPAVVLASPGRAALLVEREGYEDIIQYDRIPKWLELSDGSTGDS